MVDDKDNEPDDRKRASKEDRRATKDEQKAAEYLKKQVGAAVHCQNNISYNEAVALLKLIGELEGTYGVVENRAAEHTEKTISAVASIVNTLEQVAPKVSYSGVDLSDEIKRLREMYKDMNSDPHNRGDQDDKDNEPDPNEEILRKSKKQDAIARTP